MVIIFGETIFKNPSNMTVLALDAYFTTLSARVEAEDAQKEEELREKQTKLAQVWKWSLTNK